MATVRQMSTTADGIRPAPHRAGIRPGSRLRRHPRREADPPPLEAARIALRLIDQEFGLIDAGDKLLHHQLHLEQGEMLADAMMLAQPEGDYAFLRPVPDKGIGIGELAL